MRGGTRRLILYLREDHLVGARWRKGGLEKVLDCPLADLETRAPKLRGQAVLIIQRDSWEHRVISIPSSRKINLRQLMVREAVDMTGLIPEELALGWRMIGTSREDGVTHQKVLLVACKKAEIEEVSGALERVGIEVLDVLSALDLLVEYGRRDVGPEPGLLVVFDGELVHTLFFKDSIFGFHRVFQSSPESFAEELLLELQRSSYYAKQRFKTSLSVVKVALCPTWFGQEMMSSLTTTLQTSCNTIPFPQEALETSELGLLHLLAQEHSLLQVLCSVLPPTIRRQKEIRRVAAIATSVEILLLGLVILAIVIMQNVVRWDKEIIDRYMNGLLVLQGAIGSREAELRELARIRQAAQLVKDLLSQRTSMAKDLSDLALLIPDEVQLISLRWESAGQFKAGSRQRASPPQTSSGMEEPGRLHVEGRVEVADPLERYRILGAFLEKLKEAYPGVDLRPRTSDIPQGGTFGLSIPLRGRAR